MAGIQPERSAASAASSSPSSNAAFDFQTGVRSAVRIDRGTPGEATLYYSLEFDGPLSAEQTQVLLEAAGNCPVARTLTRLTAKRNAFTILVLMRYVSPKANA